MPDTSRLNFPSVRRNHKFYLSGGDIYFTVEDQRFRVHSYFFARESKYFAPYLERGQGIDDSTAIVLDGVCPAGAFEKFLGVFYNPKFSVFDHTATDWTSILEIAHHWDFPEVKSLAVRELEKMDFRISDRIALYQKFNLSSDLLLRYYTELCASPLPLTLEESKTVGFETSILIFHARERLRAQPSEDGKSPLPAGRQTEDVHRTINELLSPVSATDGTAGTSESTGPNDAKKVQDQKGVDKKNANRGNGRQGRN